MRCRICGKKAVYADQRLCKEHFIEFVKRKVEKVLKKVMNLEEKRILLAVSGGKDSLTMAHLLKGFDSEKELLYINLGIPDYSDEAEKIVRKFAKEHEYKLNVVKLSDYGFTIKDVYEAWKKGLIREKVCSICGLAKRYIFNSFAFEHGFDFVATAHNKTDAKAFAFLGIASGNFEYASRLAPINPGKKELRLVGRIKPLFYVTEKESMLYALLNRIKFLEATCPYAGGASQLRAKQLLAKIEEEFPNFGNNLLKLVRKLPKKEQELRTCEICGYPSTRRICKFCRVRELLNRHA